MKKKPAMSAKQLKSLLEERLSLSVASCALIHAGSRPENFALLTKDGKKYLAKCVPIVSKVNDFRDYYLPHMRLLAAIPESVHLAYEPFLVDNTLIAVLDWCDGKTLSPYRLSRAQEESVVRAYESFSRAIQGATPLLPARDPLDDRAKVLNFLGTSFSFGLRAFVARELTCEKLTYPAVPSTVIHGDFHHRNLLLEDARVTGILDLEDFRPGFVADDWVRYCVCAAEHLPWCCVGGRKKLLSLFERLLPLAKPAEWRAAVYALLIRKFRLKLQKSKSWILRAIACLNLRFRLRFYFDLQKCIDTFEKKDR